MPTKLLSKKHQKPQPTQTGSKTFQQQDKNRNIKKQGESHQGKAHVLNSQKACNYKKRLIGPNHVRRSPLDFKKCGAGPLTAITVVIILITVVGMHSFYSNYDKNDQPELFQRVEERINDNNDASTSLKDQCITPPSLETKKSTLKQNDEKDDSHNGEISQKTHVNEKCSLFLAESTLMKAGLGIFTAVDIPSHTTVGYPDIIIFLSDPNPTNVHALSLLLFDYAWESQNFGGQYEGISVFAIIPGFGMLANGHESFPNTWYSTPGNNDESLFEESNVRSPGIGAISYYYNLSFHTTRPLTAGQEFLMDYGSSWFRERKAKNRLSNVDEQSINHNGKDQTKNIPHGGENKALYRPVTWLRENGLCLDNIKADKSTIPEAGRGAFAVRFMSKGSIVAPAPLIQISTSDSMNFVRVKSSGESGQEDVLVEGSQLMLNYCFGHPKSSLLFYPYSPIVNFINHANSTKANARLQWSTSLQHRGNDWPRILSLEELKKKEHAGLMLEFVATRDILPNEEIFIDYGPSWEKAWEKHLSSWETSFHDKTGNTGVPKHQSSRFMNKYNLEDIRTEREQRQNPYPPNIFTSCYYKYSNRQNDSPVVRWKNSSGLLSFKYMRPCTIIKRENSSVEKASLYTVLIRNRYGLSAEERIPKNVRHIVTHVPRNAIQFSDKLYTTDQHLTEAFRHFIEIPNGTFPEQWKDKE